MIMSELTTLPTGPSALEASLIVLPWALKVFNLAIATFAALMMFRMETETSTPERPWTKYLGMAFVLFAVQYLFLLFQHEEKNDLLVGVNATLWQEIFSIAINSYLLSSARILLNKSKKLPRWFLLLVALDLVGVLLMVGPYKGTPEVETVPTICRFIADGISTITLTCFAYASYISSKFYRSPSRAIALGSAIGVYAVIHFISPLLPNLASLISSPSQVQETVETEVDLVLTSIAALSKLALLYFAFLITTLENRTLINFRFFLRKSLSDREVFFSGAGMLRAISEAFQDREVKLYIKVPPMKQTVGERKVDVFSWSQSQEDFKTVSESETPLPKLERELIEKESAPETTTPTSRFQFSNRFRLTRADQTEPFDGLRPMRYHGALIGCLEIEKKQDREFTYSAEGLCKIFSEDISPMVQFYRTQVSMRVLIDELNQKLEVHSQQTEALVSLEELRKKFEYIIHEVLSPFETRFVVDTGFVHTQGTLNGGAAIANFEEHIQECIPEDFSDTSVKPIGQIRLLYQPGRDPIAKPALGAFKVHRSAVGSIVTRTFLATVEKKLQHVIEKLSLELAKKQNFQSLHQHVRQSACDAELIGAVLYHPNYREFRQLQTPSESEDEAIIRSTLVESGRDFGSKLKESEGYRPQVICESPTLLILGIKLQTSGAGLFVGIERLAFAEELHLETPWRNFLTKLADVTDNAFDRIVKAKELQKKQVELAEGYMVQATAEQIGLFTHELINRVENLAGSNALLRGMLEETDNGEAIRDEVEDLRREFIDFQTLVGAIRNAARVSEQTGPCSLRKALKEVVEIHQTRTNIEIELGDITLHTPANGGSQELSDVQIALPEHIVKLTFGNLISNSIAAIRNLNDDPNSPKKLNTGRLNNRHLIRIWVDVTEGQKLIDCFVNDTGCGIPPGLMDSIFNANFSTKPEHAGLGLFLVKRRLMREGSINVEHSEPGNTTFHVCLPKDS